MTTNVVYFFENFKLFNLSTPILKTLLNVQQSTVN